MAARSPGIARRSVVLILGVTIWVAVCATELPGAGESVRPARATWDTGWFQTEIYIKALERLGYRVERPVTLENRAFYTDVANGNVDFWVNGWFPLHADLLAGGNGRSKSAGYVVKGGALQGYLVDKKTAEEHGITGLEDLKKPEIRQLFDRDGDDMADMVACTAGWSCAKVTDYHLKVYGLVHHIRPINSDYSASMTDVVTRFRDGQSIFFYTWTPNWTVGLLRPGNEVLWIEVPFQAIPGGAQYDDDLTTIAGIDGCVSDPCALGWPINDIRPVANERFLIENPTAWRLFKIMSIPLTDISAQNSKMVEGENSDTDLIRHADAWIAANAETFEDWISQANKVTRCVALMKKAFGEHAVDRWSEICIRD